MSRAGSSKSPRSSCAPRQLSVVKAHSTSLPPGFVSWSHNVIAPALVKAYLRELSLRKGARRG
jgi:hypothetical protein